MTAYRRVGDIVTCGLTACTPGSAPGPTLGNEYGKPLPFLQQKKSMGTEESSVTNTQYLTLNIIDLHSVPDNKSFS